ncbi:PREDICTED: uncharacterized protein LOC105585461 [Cercocebus atys]|uniref:uncharacterized protein LOC105585461 n=1 Tax=Cercocebus atys TaxID=9531 RepID=UPI0005F42B54|nr:PREDICTED: uncharacterized protein LOC105585461 [Cercocebus atys]
MSRSHLGRLGWHRCNPVFSQLPQCGVLNGRPQRPEASTEGRKQGKANRGCSSRGTKLHWPESPVPTLAARTEACPDAVNQSQLTPRRPFPIPEVCRGTLAACTHRHSHSWAHLDVTFECLNATSPWRLNSRA